VYVNIFYLLFPPGRSRNDVALHADRPNPSGGLVFLNPNYLIKLNFHPPFLIYLSIAG
jgi:hypothetical protein